MKRFNKNFNRKCGFTLLETMLGIAILLIASTMIFRGLMTIFQYSYDTTVFSKVAANNEDKSYRAISGNSITSTHTGTITGTGSVGSGSTNISWNVVVGDFNLTSTPNVVSSADASDVNSVSANRHAFIYQAPACPTCGSSANMHVGKNSTLGYYWFCSADNTIVDITGI